MSEVRDRADRELEIQRYRALMRETTDPIASLLLSEIVLEMEVDLDAEKTPPEEAK